MVKISPEKGWEGQTQEWGFTVNNDFITTPTHTNTHCSIKLRFLVTHRFQGHQSSKTLKIHFFLWNSSSLSFLFSCFGLGQCWNNGETVSQSAPEGCNYLSMNYKWFTNFILFNKTTIFYKKKNPTHQNVHVIYGMITRRWWMTQRPEPLSLYQLAVTFYHHL